MADEEQPEASVPYIVPAEPPTMEMDLPTPATTPPPAVPPDPPAAPAQAEPGVYVCIAENVGEHAVLGRLEFGEEYDYSAVQDPQTLEAVAACVAGGYLEKV